MSGGFSSKIPVRRLLEILAIILLIAFVVSTVLFCISIWEQRHSEYQETKLPTLGETMEIGGKKYRLKNNLETFLVLGLDKFESADKESYNNDKQADFLMLFIIDNNSSSFDVLHINRDTIAEMSILGVAGDKIGTTKKQIALAHTYGNGKEVSCRNTAEAVSKLLHNAKVEHYLSVTMDVVPLYNDLLGGVEVTVSDDFTGIDDTLVEGETVTLMGEHALNYVRTRYGLDDSTNKTRMARQRQYLNALYSKTHETVQNDSSFLENTFVNLSSYIVSDCSVNRLEKLTEKLSLYEFNEYYDFEGEIVKGEKFMEFYPDEESVKEITAKLFYTPVN